MAPDKTARRLSGRRRRQCDEQENGRGMRKPPDNPKTANRRAAPSEAKQTKRSPAGPQAKRAIVEAATLLFARKGYDGARMGDIAEAAGVPRPNLYYHFATKQQIYRAALGDLIEGWDAALARLDPARAPSDALEDYVRAKLDHARRHVSQSRLFALEVLQGGSFLKREDRAHMRRATERAAGVIEGWIASGQLRPVHPRHLLITLWASTQFYADFSMLAADALDKPRLTSADFETAAQTLVATLLRGVLPPEPAPRAAEDGSRPPGDGPLDTPRP
jgi:AcrR family transcriptional regulator